jgi:hypothetical protein
MPAAKAASKKIAIYGIEVDADTDMAALELNAYRDNWTVAEGALGAEAHFKKAWRHFWPKDQWSDWSEMIVWAWCNYRYISAIGHQRGGKTRTLAYCAYLDYIAHPWQTLTSLTTVTFEGLKLRMWAELLTAIDTSVRPQPMHVRSTTNEMRVICSQKGPDGGPTDRYQIEGIATARTHDAAGRIKGKHAPRRRIIIDEAEDVPDAIYDVLPNPMSAPDAKAVFLCNPIEKISKMGAMCEPKNGWGTIGDSDLFWETKGGGICLHFDGLQSPNMKAGRTVFPYLLTKESVEEVRGKYGEDSAQWWSLIRGWFVPDGVAGKIFPSSVILKGREVLSFDFPPAACASLDPAFEHDACVLHLGQSGRLRGGRLAINCTETRVLKTVVSTSSEPKDYQIAHQVMKICQQNGVQPDHFIMDRSGGGRGTFAILQKEWSPDVQGIDYGGAATDRILVHGETQKCCDIYQYFVTELWFRARVFIEHGLLGGLQNLDSLTEDDLNSRRYTLKKVTRGTVQVAEQKTEVKSRLGRSPDWGDAFVQFAELLVRLGGLPGAGPGWFEERLRWGKQKERAKKANAVYGDVKEFSYY